jgi:hypothetical protein
LTTGSNAWTAGCASEAATKEKALHFSTLHASPLFSLSTFVSIDNNKLFQITKSKQQITNHKSINRESSSLTASLNTPKSDADLREYINLNVKPGFSIGFRR